MRKLKYLLIPTLIGFAFTFSACEDDDDSPDPTQDAIDDMTDMAETDGEDPMTYVRVFHGADAPTVDVWVNDNAPGSESPLNDLEQYAAAGGDAQGYIALPAGTYDIAVTTADETDVSNAVIDVDGVALAADTYYTAFAYGDASAESGSADALGLGLIEDDISAPDSGNGRVTVAHSATGVGPVDIFSSGTVVSGLEDFDLGESGGSVDLPAANYTFGIGATGAAEPLVEYTVDLPALRVSAFAIGSLSEGVNLAILLPDNTVLIVEPDAYARVLHASSNADAASSSGVDVYRGEASVVAGLEFEDGTPYVNVPSGDQAFDVYAAGADIEEDSPALAIPSLTYEPGASYTLVAYDDGEGGITGARYEDTFEDSSDVNLKFAHNAPGVGSGDDNIVTVISLGETDTTLFEDVAFGESAPAVGEAAVLVPAASYSLGVDLNDDDAEEATLTADVTGLGGQLVRAHAYITAAEAPAVLVLLEDGTTLSLPITILD
jgi:hypothetical protein